MRRVSDMQRKRPAVPVWKREALLTPMHSALQSCVVDSAGQAYYLPEQSSNAMLAHTCAHAVQCM